MEVSCFIQEDVRTTAQGIEHVLKSADLRGTSFVDCDELEEVIGRWSPAIVIFGLRFTRSTARHFMQSLASSCRGVQPVLYLNSFELREAALLQMDFEFTILPDSLDSREVWDAIMVARQLAKKKARAAQERDELVAKLELLTTEEREVLRLWVHGVSNAVISSKLNVAIRTIHDRKKTLLTKLRIENVFELIRAMAAFNVDIPVMTIQEV